MVQEGRRGLTVVDVVKAAELASQPKGGDHVHVDNLDRVKGARQCDRKRDGAVESHVDAAVAKGSAVSKSQSAKAPRALLGRALPHT